MPPRRQQQGLERVLGAPALFATAYGNVGSSIYYALGVTAALALGLTPLVFIIAGLIFAATAATYAEGTVRFPEAGGSSSFARHAFNEVVSFGAAWAQMLNYIITIAISAFFVPHYLSIFWDPLKENPWDVIVGALVVVLLVAINIVGVKEAARLNVLLAVIDFATQALLVILGFVLIFSPEVLVDNVHFGVAPTWQSFFLAIPVAMIAYTGIETISNLSEEARDPSRDIPRSIRLVAVAVYAIYFTLPAIALSALPVTEGPDGFTTQLGQPPEDGGFANDPVLGIVDNLGVEGGLLRVLEVYVGVLAATILFIAANAGVIGASRITYAMASYRQLPEPFRRLHRRFKTPWLALVLFAGLASIIAILPGQTDFLGTMYAFGAMLSFTVAHVSVVALRVRRPDEELVYRARPNLRLGGIDWPLFAILGGLATGLAWLVVVVQEPATRWAGLAWLALGFVVYVVYRRETLAPAAARDRAGARDRARRRAAGGVPLDRGPGRAVGRVGGGPGHRRAPRRGAALPRCHRPRARGADGAAAHGQPALGRAGGQRPARRRPGAGGELRRPRGHPPRAGAQRRPGDRRRRGRPHRRPRGHRCAAAGARPPDAGLRQDRPPRPQEQPLPGDRRRDAR